MGIRTEQITELRDALNRARLQLLELSAEFDSRAIERALDRTDEAVSWAGKIVLSAPRKPKPVDENESCGEGEQAWNEDGGLAAPTKAVSNDRDNTL